MKKVTIIGSGVVGKATGLGFSSKGYEVTFLDIDPKRVQKLHEEGLNAFAVSEIDPKTFETDVEIFTVPTPTVDGRIDLTPLQKAASQLAQRLKHAKNYRLIVTRSTMLPGTTRSIVENIIEKESGKKAGIDFGVCMNPEYLREQSAKEDFAKPWIIVIGQYDDKSGSILEEMYSHFECEKHRVSLEEAEMQKYMHNLFNAAKISFYNEFRNVAKAMDLDANKIMKLTAKSCEGMWNPNYGIKDMGPFGRSCLPKDTQAFYIWAQEQGYDMKMLKAAMEVNQHLLDQLVDDKEKFHAWLEMNGLKLEEIEKASNGKVDILKKLALKLNAHPNT